MEGVAEEEEEEEDDDSRNDHTGVDRVRGAQSLAVHHGREQ
jgi:hypothetical protein